MVLIINLNISVDTIQIINNFQVDRVFRPQETIEAAGGKGINIARVLNTLKIKNILIGFVGGNKTNIILDSLKKDRINFIPAPVHKNSRTCHHIIDKKNRTETVINENGPEIIKQELDNFLKLFHKVFTTDIQYLVIAGSQQPGIPDNFTAKLVSYAKENHVFTIIDNSQKPLNLAIKAKPDLIKPNKKEFQNIIKKQKLTNLDIKNALIDLNKNGIKYPIITLGKQGSIALNPDTKKIIKIIPPAVNKISTIGSGDAFTAGLLYSFINKYSYSDTLRMATAAAAANAITLGAGSLNKKNIFQLYKKVIIN